jgi:hypothetical protein
VKPDRASGRSPAIGRALLDPPVARTAGRFDVGFHHRAERLDSCREIEPLEALLDLRQGFIHSSGNRSRRQCVARTENLTPKTSIRLTQCAIFLHGVALLRGFDTPSLTAQGGQRRQLQKFNTDRDIPPHGAVHGIGMNLYIFESFWIKLHFVTENKSEIILHSLTVLCWFLDPPHLEGSARIS